MSEAPEESSALEAAAAAAGAGDFAAAERHLNRAVELKEARLGPMDPDLASILNNLGVVHEHLDQPDDAERCYRRAHAIATAVLAPDDPAVVLSTKNLQDFCTARGIPFEQAASAFARRGASAFAAGAASSFAAGAATADKTADRSADKPAASASAPHGATADKPVAPVKISPRTLAIGWLVVVGVILGAIVIGTRSRSKSPEPVASGPVASPVESTPVAPAPAAPSREPAPVPATPTLPAPGPAPKPQPAAKPAPPSATSRSAASAATPTLVSAQLCRGIETGDVWRCTPISGSLEPGPVFFYTRLTCRSDTTVEHRWYRANRLQQTMTLHIKANEGTGYRTYSRATIGADRPGEWKVELRAMDGTMLHEERFTVGAQ